MNRFSIEIPGICLFELTTIGTVTNARRLHLPEASQNPIYLGKPIDPHTAYVAVDTASVDESKSTWDASSHFTLNGVAFSLFPLSGGLSLSTNATGPAWNPAGQDGRLPHLNDWCNGYAVDPAKLASAVAASMEMTIGEITATDAFVKGHAAVSSWHLDADGDLVITARDKAGASKQITVTWSTNTTISIGNQPIKEIHGTPFQSTENHFLIYYLLSKSACDPAKFPIHIPHAPAPRGGVVTLSLKADCSNAFLP